MISSTSLVYEKRNKNSFKEQYFEQKIGSFKKSSEFAVHLHLYYTENWEELFKDKLKCLNKKIVFDLYVTMPANNLQYVDNLKADFKEVNVLIVPNRGRDVLPFIKTAKILKDNGYKKVLKIHSKKSTHRDTEGNSAENGDNWLHNTINSLIPSNVKLLDNLIRHLKDPKTGIIGAKDYYYPLKMYSNNNFYWIKTIMDSIDDKFSTGLMSKRFDDLNFFGGTMFWIDLSTINNVLDISLSNFEKESGQTDGTLAHALERVFCILPEIKKKNVFGISPTGISEVKKGAYPDWYFDDISGGKPRINIVVPVYGDWNSLSKNIKSLIKYVGSSEEIAVYYVNDCGPEADDLESKILHQISGLTNFYYHRNEENLGFVKTCNRAAFEITDKSSDILLLNSDTKVTNGFAHAMKQVLYSQERIGAVTARSNNATIWSVPMTSKLAQHQILSYLLYRFMKRSIDTKYITPTVHGFCVIVRRSVINKYGLFDEIYGKGYGEENDFAMRIQRKGWHCAVANGAFVFHYESRSFGSEERNAQIKINEKILVERYPEYRTKVQEYWDKIEEPLK